MLCASQQIKIINTRTTNPHHIHRVGAGVLSLPASFAALQWPGGVASLVLATVISLYTILQLAWMHEQRGGRSGGKGGGKFGGEAPPPRRMNRYHQLTQFAFVSFFMRLVFFVFNFGCGELASSAAVLTRSPSLHSPLNQTKTKGPRTGRWMLLPFQLAVCIGGAITCEREGERAARAAHAQKNRPPFSSSPSSSSLTEWHTNTKNEKKTRSRAARRCAACGSTRARAAGTPTRASRRAT